MIILNEKWTSPLKPESVFTASAYTAVIPGIPDSIDGYNITGVKIRVTNADAVPFVADARKRNGLWVATFSASCFDNYGIVKKGLLISLEGRDATGDSQTWKRACGDFEVVPDTVDAVPGNPGNSFVAKGGDCYLKSYINGNAQHYVKQVMLYDEDMAAWGADWIGDYILVDGEFVELEDTEDRGEVAEGMIRDA